MSGEYLGDFPTGKTIYVYFNTFDSNDPSASVTLTGLAVTDIEIYKNGSTTQRSSDAGYTLLDTDGIDFDGITGIHGFSIDTSDNTDAGFYAAGNDYTVIVSSVTVDAATINFIAARFSIDNRGLLRPTTAQRTLDVTATGAAGVDWANVENQSTSVNLSATTTNLVNTVTTYTGNTVQTGDSFARLGAPAGASVSADIAAIEAQTDDIGVAGAGLTAVPWNAAWDAEVQSECTDALVAYDPPTNAEMEARTLVAANYFDPAADTVATVTTLTNLPAITANWLTAAGTAADFTTEIQAGLATAAALATLDTVADNLNLGIIYGAAVTGTLSTTVATSDLTGYADDQLIGRIITWLTGNCAGEQTDITDYANTNGTLTFTALTTAPGNGDTFKIT